MDTVPPGGTLIGVVEVEEGVNDKFTVREALDLISVDRCVKKIAAGKPTRIRASSPNLTNGFFLKKDIKPYSA
ncbi:MAG TPA: hypothetical protein VM077_05220 [Candidatus Limnocylindrales bacterium]|nr:hypothetical protein [Candidatus Limnocylindrales bacterium]